MTPLSHMAILIRQLQGALGGRRLMFGAGTWTWPGGAALSNTVAVTHGLGATPLFVFVCGAQAQGQVVAGDAFTYGATTFSTHGEFVGGFLPALNATSGFVWLAVA